TRCAPRFAAVLARALDVRSTSGGSLPSPTPPEADPDEGRPAAAWGFRVVFYKRGTLACAARSAAVLARALDVRSTSGATLPSPTPPEADADEGRRAAAWVFRVVSYKRGSLACAARSAALLARALDVRSTSGGSLPSPTPPEADTDEGRPAAAVSAELTT